MTHIFIAIFLGDKPQASLIKPQFTILECATRRPKMAPATAIKDISSVVVQ